MCIEFCKYLYIRKNAKLILEANCNKQESNPEIKEASTTRLHKFFGHITIFIILIIINNTIYTYYYYYNLYILLLLQFIYIIINIIYTYYY